MRKTRLKQRMTRWQWWVGLPLLLILCLPFFTFYLAALPFRVAGAIGVALNWISVELNYWTGAKFKWLLKWMIES